jgi:SAM-dependent methyltransferase
MTRRRDCLISGGALLAAGALPGRVLGQPAASLPPSPAPDGEPARRPDVVYVPTPQDIVDEMLAIASVGPDDVLYDLGSGDGRIPITAAKRWGTRGLGIDIDPQRIGEAQANARAAGVVDRVRFVQGDLFAMDLSPATVITLYLLPALNVKLRPKLLQLKPGTRIVSHDFAMGDWKPVRTVENGSRTVYFWTVPPAGRPYPKG